MEGSTLLEELVQLGILHSFRNYTKKVKASAVAEGERKREREKLF